MGGSSIRNFDRMGWVCCMKHNRDMLFKVNKLLFFAKFVYFRLLNLIINGANVCLLFLNMPRIWQTGLS